MAEVEKKDINIKKTATVCVSLLIILIILAFAFGLFDASEKTESETQSKTQIETQSEPQAVETQPKSQIINTCEELETRTKMAIVKRLFDKEIVEKHPEDYSQFAVQSNYWRSLIWEQKKLLIEVLAIYYSCMEKQPPYIHLYEMYTQKLVGKGGLTTYGVVIYP